MKINSRYIKLALLEYFRFDRGYVVATECMNEDVLAMNDKHSIGVEIKISTNDLFRDHKKIKHYHIKHAVQRTDKIFANKFFYCILPNMREKAEEYIFNINIDYGIMIYYPETVANKPKIKIYKQAKLLHNHYSEDIRKKIMMRLSLEVINYYKKELYS